MPPMMPPMPPPPGPAPAPATMPAPALGAQSRARMGVGLAMKVLTQALQAFDVGTDEGKTIQDALRKLAGTLGGPPEQGRQATEAQALARGGGAPPSGAPPGGRPAGPGAGGPGGPGGPGMNPQQLNALRAQ